MWSASSPDRFVQHTRELQRILAIERRIWTDADATDLAARLTAILRLARGTMALRPVQAQALYEAEKVGGLFGPIRVGGGKTLLSLLVAFVLGSRRPILLLPAKLIEKTKREMRELALHWPIPNFIRIVSYEMLGRTQSSNLLEQYAPDLIVADECHKLKNTKAAVTKRVARYMSGAPGTRFVAISGTITSRSVKDYAHILRWCLKPESCPLPLSWHELEDWADALDEKPNSENTCDVGALAFFCSEEERREPTLTGTRKAIRRRLTETPGVVATREIHDASCSLSIASYEVAQGPAITAAFKLLRDDWTTPDGWPIADPMTMWRHARELAVGFFYKWDPRPPDDWILARKEWYKACREILGSNRRQLDSLLEVTNAVDAGHYPEAMPLLEAWRAIEKSFTPNTVPVWLDYAVIEAVKLWAYRAPGIVWTEHRAFAIELARQTRLSYYGSKGQDENGRPIEAHDPTESLIASVASNAEGRNLQAFSRNMIVSPPPNGRIWEQLLARTHRDGQLEDEVTFDVILTCLEHANAFQQARYDAQYIEHSTGQAQKLIYADVMFADVSLNSGPKWSKEKQED
jgi:hypothetical protein